MTTPAAASVPTAEAEGVSSDGGDAAGATRSTLAWWVGVGLLLTLVGAVIPTLIAHHYGALGLPRSDDWSYTLSVFRWVDDGRLGFNNWAGTTLIGQFLLAAPIAALFPRSITAIHVASAAMSWVGLLAVVWLARRFVRPSWSVFLACTIAVSPLWFALAPTFMTDNWAFGLQMASLAAALVAFRAKPPVHLGWFTLSLVLGFGAVSIRQYALVPVIAVSIVGVVASARGGDRRSLRMLLALLVGAAVCTGVLLVWWSQRPTLDTLPIGFPTGTRLRTTAQLDVGYARLLGLLLAPVVVVARPWRTVRRAFDASLGLSVIAGGLVGSALVLEFVKYPQTPFVGNYVTRSGILGQDVLAGARPDVVPALLFDALVWIAMASAVVIVLAAVPAVAAWWRSGASPLRWASPETATLTWCFVGYAAAFTLVGLTGLPTDDRYVLPVVPLVGIAVLRAAATATAAVPEGSQDTASVPATRGPSVFAGGALALLLALGVSYGVESASFDSVRWAVAEKATKAGFAPTQVDGGFEWVAWHRQLGPPVGRSLDPSRRKQVLAAFDEPFCVRVEIDPKRVPAHVVAQARAGAWTRPSARVVAYKLDRPCTPGHP